VEQIVFLQTYVIKYGQLAKDVLVAFANEANVLVVSPLVGEELLYLVF